MRIVSKRASTRSLSFNKEERPVIDISQPAAAVCALRLCEVLAIEPFGSRSIPKAIMSAGAAVNDRKHRELSIYVGVPGIGNRYYGPNGQQRDIQTATMHQPYGCMHRRMDVHMEGMHGRF